MYTDIPNKLFCCFKAGLLIYPADYEIPQLIPKGPVIITGRMTIHDTIDHKHNVECDGEGSNEMANSHLHFTDSGTLSYARFCLLAVISQILQLWGVEAKGQVHYQKIPRKDCLLSPASCWELICWFHSASFQPPPAPTPSHPTPHSHSNCEDERDITNGTVMFCVQNARSIL